MGMQALEEAGASAAAAHAAAEQGAQELRGQVAALQDECAVQRQEVTTLTPNSNPETHSDHAWHNTQMLM